MNAELLRNRQAPLKSRYREDPTSARLILTARGTLRPDTLTCRIEADRVSVEVGLHPMAGGEDRWACSGEMLLESLVGCAGVTLLAVASALQLEIRAGTVRAEGDLDLRGTLGVNKEVPVGFSAIRLHFDLDTGVSEDQRANLLRLTERYCVVFQTLKHSASLSASIATNPLSPGS